jgi:hypothetical protein
VSIKSDGFDLPVLSLSTPNSNRKLTVGFNARLIVDANLSLILPATSIHSGSA